MKDMLEMLYQFVFGTLFFFTTIYYWKQFEMYFVLSLGMLIFFRRVYIAGEKDESIH